MDIRCTLHTLQMFSKCFMSRGELTFRSNSLRLHSSKCGTKWKLHYCFVVSLSLKMNFITPNSSKLLIVLHFHHLLGLKWGLSKFKNFLKGKSCLFTNVYNITTNCCKPIFFQIKFTLFGNKRDIVSVQSLACLVIGYTLVAHGRICIHKSQDLLFIFDPPSFGRSYGAHFKPKWRVVNGYSGAKWRAT